VAVSGLGSGVSAISSSATGEHTCALTSAGAAECWGNNDLGQLGNGTTTNSTTPVAVSGLGSGVSAISVGGDHSCALTSAGAVKCWGDNGNGELGNGTTTPSSTPVAVSGLGSGVSAISAGEDHTCALTSAGAVQCWGFNGFGQLGNGTTTDSSTPVAVSSPGGGVSAITAEGFHSCALTSAGAAECWGFNGFGELGDATTTDRHEPVFVSGTVAPPGALISSPAAGATYAVGQSVSTSFVCSEGADGPGLSSCADSTGTSTRSGGSGHLDTLTTGQHSYTVTAISGDGLTGSAEITYTVAAAPSAQVSSPTSGGIYAVAQVVATSFSCAEGTDGPGIQSCTDSNGSGTPGALDTRTVGMHTYAVTATSKDGQTGKASITYTVAAAPSASITTPANGATYAQGRAVSSSFSCAEGAGGLGIKSCLDQNGHPSGSAVDTSIPGRHAFTVTATSKDGQTGHSSVTYTVAGGPSASISSPPNGEAYVRGQKVATSFGCADDTGGPGIASCKDSHGASAPHGKLYTSSAGHHTYTVTATSSDGQSTTATIGYTVKVLRLSHLRLAPRAFAAATGGPAILARLDVGTIISYLDSFAGHTTFRVMRCTNGSCGRVALIDKFTHHDQAGRNRLQFTGRLRGRALAPGHYVLLATTTLDGQRSHRVAARFTILPRPTICKDPDHDRDCDAPGQV
jgi:hypothetical protein